MRLVTIALALCALGGRAALACAPAPHAGDDVVIVEESAVIVWDPATKTEHFIRRATFRGKGRDFGFLVPTPAAPTLAAVDDAIFDALEARTRRETVHVTRKKIDWTPLVMLVFGRKGEGMLTGVAPVQVLSTQKVAGYEAVVLAATDAGALQKWLADRDYAATPDLVEWLDVYVRKQWKITAFKIDTSQPEIAARTTAVKMSFTTDRPFFPYREPASQRRLSSNVNTSRALAVWVLGPERVRGTVGDAERWPGVLRRSDPLPEPLRAEVMKLANVTLPPAVRMTAFLDQSAVRPGFDDLFFSRSAVQGAYVEPPWIETTVDTTHVPIDVLALAVLVVGLLVFAVTRLL